MAVETLVAPLARGHYARQARANRVRAGAVVGAGWLVLAMSVVLFLAEDGLGRFSDLGSSINALGIIAGLIATSALLLMLLLAARVPLIDRALAWRHDHAPDDMTEMLRFVAWAVERAQAADAD